MRQGERTFERSFSCMFCYQTPPETHVCENPTDCEVSESQAMIPRKCSPPSDVLCMGTFNTLSLLYLTSFVAGARQFTRNLQCNWTSGTRWSTALSLRCAAAALSNTFFSYI